jgi:DNA-binding transcriptional MerR regulator
VFAYPLIFLPFISSAFVPTRTMPAPVRAFAENQPVTSIVDTIRRLCAQQLVRAVRHYHQIGLLPEPERDRSGYRSYDAAAVVRLIRIRTLADAGVPLARVQELLDAGPKELAAGEQPALPRSVVGYLDRLRGLGVEERYIEMERDAWIMVAAQVPHLIDFVIAKKHEQLDEPDMVKLCSFFRGALDWPADDPRVVEIADIVEGLRMRAVEAGEAGAGGFDDQFVDLLDSTMAESSPGAERLVAILAERGWKCWTRIERVPADSLDTDLPP